MTTPGVRLEEKPTPRLWLGALLLLAALAGSIVLSLSSWSVAGLPGCGTGTPCAKAQASAWSKVPGLEWPIAMVGAAHFGAMLVAWLVSRGRLARGVLAWAWAGAAMSIAYSVIAIAKDMPCAYCLGVHAANLAFVALATIGRAMRGAAPGPGRVAPASARAPTSGAPLAAGLVAFLALIGVGSYIDADARARAKQRAEAALTQSTRDIAKAAQAPTPAPAPTTQALTPEAEEKPGFEGRYRRGPLAARARVVVFTDFQCPDCKRVEEELEALLASEPGVALSIKHFPLSRVCNPNVTEEVHADACFAAQAAEAAGILGGGEGFWRASSWLFGRAGSFTRDQAMLFARDQGWDPARFVTLMGSPMVAQRLKSDIDEGWGLGLRVTPMIFINGVELKGWNAEQAVTRGVRAALQANPVGRSSASDRPPPAPEKFVGDWRESPVVAIPPEAMRRVLGPADSPVTVVVFADLLEKNGVEVDGIVRLFTSPPGMAVRYAFQHYPLDQSCNPQAPKTMTPGSCEASIMAEAAALIGGDEAYWRVHDWITRNREALAPMAGQGSMMASAAHELGLDVAQWKEVADNPAIAEIIRSDVARGRALGITRLPAIFVNGRQVPEWKVNNENILPRIFNAAEELTRRAPATP